MSMSISDKYYSKKYNKYKTKYLNLCNKSNSKFNSKSNQEGGEIQEGGFVEGNYLYVSVDDKYKLSLPESSGKTDPSKPGEYVEFGEKKYILPSVTSFTGKEGLNTKFKGAFRIREIDDKTGTKAGHIWRVQTVGQTIGKFLGIPAGFSTMIKEMMPDDANRKKILDYVQLYDDAINGEDKVKLRIPADAMPERITKKEDIQKIIQHLRERFGIDFKYAYYVRLQKIGKNSLLAKYVYDSGISAPTVQVAPEVENKAMAEINEGLQA